MSGSDDLDVDAWMLDVNTKLDWLVSSMTALMRLYVAGEAPEIVPEPPDEPDLPIAPQPPQQSPNGACTHQHQQLRGRDIVCAKCGHILQANTGVYDRPVLMPE